MAGAWKPVVKKKKVKNSLNSQKVMYCKKKVVWNILRIIERQFNSSVIWLIVAYTSREH